MNRDLFIKEVSKLGIELSQEQLNQIDIYCKYLIEYNFLMKFMENL